MGISELFKDLIQFKFLLQQTVVRELRVRYKQTLIGVFWAVLQPLLFATIFYYLFAGIKSEFLELPEEPSPLLHFVVLFVSMSFWMFFNNTVLLSTASITGHPGLVTKVYFPRQVFPISFLCVGLVDLGLNILLAAVLCVIGGILPSAIGLCWLLASMFLLIIFTASCSILLAGLNVFYRDFKYIMPIGLQVLFFLSPIFYSRSFITETFGELIGLNPLSPLFTGLRHAFNGEVVPVLQFGINGFLIILWAEICLRIFRRLNQKMADVI
jgi:lipopolysaccharide transport system permease protein